MLYLLRNAWALLLGMLLLMVGNGVQGTLLGIRGSLEGFPPDVMSYLMSAYMLGMLIGSQIAPILISQVGHVRVFAALASLISASFLGFAIFVDPIAWFTLRLLVGFCFSGVYVASESWLNEAASNENRGKAMSVYMIVQTFGILLAQILINFGDPSSFILFAVISVLVSISFAPILLSVSRVPVFTTSKRMSLKELYKASPLGSITMILLGGVNSLLFGMSAVYGSEKGLSIKEISILVGSIYVAGALFQYPVGFISDRIDRRKLIIILASFGLIGVLAGFALSQNYYIVLFAFFIAGGVANPLYSVVIAYTNDYLDMDDMSSAAGGLVFMSGVGGIVLPVLTGQLMNKFGQESLLFILGLTFLTIVVYGLYRSTKRSGLDVELSTAHVSIMPQATNVAVEISQEAAIEESLVSDSI
jgi:MFS family permease